MQPESEDAPSTVDAPPQPPLPEDDETPPPVVEGIEETANTEEEQGTAEIELEVAEPSSNTEEDGPVIPQAQAELESVPPSDIRAFIELYARFQTRIDRLASGRKYKPLRDAWESARVEMSRFDDRINLYAVSDKVLEGLRLGCESGKVLIVDACLDCIHRLFEYGHIGSGGEGTDIVLDYREGILDEIVHMVCGCLEVKEEEVYLRMVQTILTAATRTKSGLHHGILLAAVRTVYNIYLNARAPGTRTTARVSLTQILTLVFGRMEAEVADEDSHVPENLLNRAMASSGADGVSSDRSTPAGDGVDVPKPEPPPIEGGDAALDFASVLQKDAYLLFRALCKISAKEVPDGSAPDSVGIRSKLLSLELLRNLVSNSGPAFRTGERFIYALRQYLAPSLLSNSMSSSMPVVDCSLDIFEILLRKETLRPLLKTEIGALFDTVIFRFLESPTAGPARRRRAIELMHRLSTDHQTLADLFLNYDCDMESSKIFEHIVSALSGTTEMKESGGGTIADIETHSSSSSGQSLHQYLRITALSAIVQIVASLRNWSKPVEDARTSASNVVKEASSSLDVNGSNRAEGINNEIGTSTAVISVDGHEEPDVDEVTDSRSSLRQDRRQTPAATSVLGRVSEGSDRDTSKFEEALKAKRILAEGVSRFNTKPKTGIAHLVSHGKLENEPKSVASFLRRSENLDATMVGEYLGEGDPFNISVMHAYTDMYDFTDLTFDGALRLHLSGFRLPGEAQKIDRVMEKFASRFCECNPEIFANADAAYVLAYSVIILHTDAHNATIKNKMSKEEFIRNNRGINDGGDIDRELLSALYDRITSTEISLSGTMKDSAKETAEAAMGNASNAINAASLDPAQKAKQFKEESERLMSETRVLFANKRKTAEDYTYYSATNVYHARLMFESAWCPVLAAISLLLEEASSSESNIVSLCLEGFRNGIAIASTFSMSTAKDAFVSSLAKFTHLNSISEMRSKNVECVRMVLAIAALEGNNLGDQWVVIVKAISQLEQIRAVVAGNPGKYILQKAPLLNVSSKRRSGDRESLSQRAGTGKGPQSPSFQDPVRKTSGRTTSSRRSSSSQSSSSQLGRSDSSGGAGMTFSPIRIDPKVASLASTIRESEIERIFTNSANLTASGVADFCGALCAISLEELREAGGPRLFCLQKIVELAYYNMDSRTRFEWGKIWEKMGPFFASAMCHSNKDVAMYAIDSLRQLASKFLEKDELSNFSFQRAFLKPFEVCFNESKAASVRELVLTCVSQIVLARASNIKSGWKSVFSVLAQAANDKSEAILNFGFEQVKSIVQKYLGVFDDVFVDAVNGISAYTRASLSTQISLAAIQLLQNDCASALAEGKALSSVRPNEEESGTNSPPNRSQDSIVFSADVDSHIGSWFPILTGLAAAIQDDRHPVRDAAADGLYKVLEDHGGKFSSSLWVLVFRGVLLPTFDDVRYLSSSADRMESTEISNWASTAGASCLRSLIDVFVMHFEVTRELLGELLELLRRWVLQESEVVAREGMGVFARLLIRSGDVFEPAEWQQAVDAVGLLFVDTMPYEILGPSRLDPGTADEDDSIKSFKDINYDRANGAESFHAPSDSIGNKKVPAKGQNADYTHLDSPTKAFSSSENGTPNGKAVVEKSQTQKIDFRVVRAKCVVQLLLVQLVQDVIVSFYLKLSTSHVHELAEALQRSYSFAQRFNANIDLRYSLWRSGFMNQVPNLLKQETSGLTSYLRIMFWLYLDSKRVDVLDELEQNVVSLCEKVLRRYITSCEAHDPKTDDDREVKALTPVVILTVNGMMQMSSEQFEKHLGNLYNILLELIESAHEREVRRAVCRLFRVRIGPKLRNISGKFEGSTGQVEEIEVNPIEPEYVARPQLPGAVRERVLAIEGEDSAENVGSIVQSALMKLSGVRSANVNMEEGIARLILSTPDDMLLSTVKAIPEVQTVFVVQSANSSVFAG